MDIVFCGICCFVDPAPPKTGKTILVRNALRGGMHRGKAIPPHYAFIHAKRDQVDTRRWGSGWFGGEDNLMLWLTGDVLTFDPMPGGGSIDISHLPHVRSSSDAICPAADEIRFQVRENPSSANVLALIHLPSDAHVTSGVNAQGAAFATLHMGNGPVTITARPFVDGSGVPRSVTIVDPDAQIFISNVDIDGYLLGRGAPDNDHKYLVCDLFKPGSAGSTRSGEAIRKQSPPIKPGLATAAEESSTDRVTLTSLQRAAGRGMKDFLSTFAAGCSASQWP